MIRTKTTLAIALALAAVSFAGHAQTTTPPALGASTPKVDKRGENQQQRIDAKQSSGALTEREAARLEKQQANMAKAEEKAKADGTVTAKERAALNKAAKRNSRQIARQTHDKQTTDTNQPAKP